MVVFRVFAQGTGDKIGAVSHPVSGYLTDVA